MSLPPFEVVVGTVDLTVPHNVLLSLDEAADLPRLAGRFSTRDLRRYASPKRKRNRLPAVKPGREYLTTPTWIDDWIEGMVSGTPPAADAAPPARATGVPAMSDAAAAAAASLEARLAKGPPKSKPSRKGK